MISQAKKVLHINLSKKTYEVKSYPDFEHYIGGVGLGLKLLLTYRHLEPIIFSVGPLNGFFPFASKTSVVIEDSGVVEDVYLGGSLSFRIRFSGIDSIMLTGRSEEPLVVSTKNDHVEFYSLDKDLSHIGLPGKTSRLDFTSEGIVLDNYFKAPGKFLEKRLVEKNVKSLVVTGTNYLEISDPQRYSQLFNKLLKSTDLLSVEHGSNPSCSGCPMGCDKSQKGEIGGNVLVHSLVACSFAQKVYSDVGTIFACLNTLGYKYTHEDIENLQDLVHETLEDLSQHSEVASNSI